ncbi:MAG: hypothetical protein M3Q67_01875 [Actinomycetota bacterium]|nr:hypothetical protein [Actinomycetota bacterium]MDQ3085534.1 hypothetical protein [Actinomycetota bacterium]MDQ3425482.1 hypothetical protein [Actinomycetota bacterium]
MRALYRIWATLLFILVIVQVGLAGYGAFYAANKLEDEGSTIDEDVFFDGFGAHALFGYLVLLAGLIFLVIGVAAGVGKWRLGRHGVLFALLILQVLLAWVGFGVPAIGFLHPVNALLIFGLLGWIASNEWRMSRAAPTSAAVSP